MKKFSCRVDDLEIRSCDTNLMQTNNPHTTAELVRWREGACYTLGYFEQTMELDYDFTFVGGRMFDKPLPWDEVGFMLTMAYDILQKGETE